MEDIVRHYLRFAREKLSLMPRYRLAFRDVTNAVHQTARTKRGAKSTGTGTNERKK